MARTQEPENILGPRSEARRTAPAEAIRQHGPAEGV
ncbi:hypothetical protein FHX41_1560 [Actinomadura hallensis]|uniref:Uncharacterized protein n=1 Tax=Actinomadura hallensis TaxID=337895 RepID=A0A543IBH0_9ACTN|nr:hypothetical protein FHX41_1560 [Actinomadura hallensis]